MPYTGGIVWCAHAADNAHLHLINVGCGHHCAGTGEIQLLLEPLLPTGTLPASTAQDEKDGETRKTRTPFILS